MSVYYNFKNVAELVDLLCAVFDTATGHDHDGTNSKAVTTGTPGANTITTAMLQAACIAASTAGRAKMATDFFNAAAVVLDKFSADSFTNAVLLQLIADGAFVADASTRALFADGFMPPEKLTAAANQKLIVIPIEDLAAGADIADRTLFYVPAGVDYTLVSVGIIPRGASVGIDDSNTAVIALKDGSANAIVSKTYDTDPQPPAAGVIGDLGSLSGTYKILSAGEKLVLDVTQGATANLPAFDLQIVLTQATAA
jgi:hypothetical protein